MALMKHSLAGGLWSLNNCYARNYEHWNLKSTALGNYCDIDEIALKIVLNQARTPDFLFPELRFTPKYRMLSTELMDLAGYSY